MIPANCPCIRCVKLLERILGPHVARPERERPKEASGKKACRNVVFYNTGSSFTTPLTEASLTQLMPGNGGQRPKLIFWYERRDLPGAVGHGPSSVHAVSFKLLGGSYNFATTRSLSTSRTISVLIVSKTWKLTLMSRYPTLLLSASWNLVQ